MSEQSTQPLSNVPAIVSSNTTRVFPFSHSRSDSTYAPAHSQPLSLKRTNSIRSSKDIIPLQLTAAQSSARPTVATTDPAPHIRHRRGFSVGVARNDTAQLADIKKSRPGSMFFGRLTSHKEDEVLSSSPSRSPTRGAHNEHLRGGSRASLCIDTRSLDYFNPQPSSRNTSPFHQSRACDCASIQKAEARLYAKIADLETERETKNLTISMLSEQLVDKSQELNLLKEKMQVMESLLADNTHLRTPHVMRGPSSCYSAYPGRTTSSCYSVDEGIASSSASTASRPTSPTSADTPITQSSVEERRISLTAIDADLSYEDLVDENVLLKEEVSRLTNVLEDGIGALAHLGL